MGTIPLDGYKGPGLSMAMPKCDTEKFRKGALKMCERKYKVGDFVECKDGKFLYLAFYDDNDGMFLLMKTENYFGEDFVPVAGTGDWYYTSEIEEMEKVKKPEIIEGTLTSKDDKLIMYYDGKFVRWDDVKHFYEGPRL